MEVFLLSPSIRAHQCLRDASSCDDPERVSEANLLGRAEALRRELRALKKPRDVLVNSHWISTL